MSHKPTRNTVVLQSLIILHATKANLLPDPSSPVVNTIGEKKCQETFSLKLVSRLGCDYLMNRSVEIDGSVIKNYATRKRKISENAPFRKSFFSDTVFGEK